MEDVQPTFLILKVQSVTSNDTEPMKAFDGGKNVVLCSKLNRFGL